MRQFLIKMLAVFIVFYIALLLLQSYIDNRLQNSKNPFYYDWNLLMKGKINAPMIFKGNSRTEVHYDTQIIEKNTGISSYNLGIAGTSLAIEQIRWKSYLAHNKSPKIVVQNIDLYALSNKPIAYKNQYLPYYSDSVFFEELKKIDTTVLYEKYIPMSKYRGSIALLSEEFGIARNTNKITQKTKGYLKHSAKWNFNLANMKKSIQKNNNRFKTSEIEFQLQVLQNIIKDCRAINATLILVWAPQYYELSAIQEPTLHKIKNQIRQIALENKNVLFWDFTKDYITKDKKYFYNSFHMNDVGVAIFCRQFSDSLNVFQKKSIP